MTAHHASALAAVETAELAAWAAARRDDETAAIDDEARESTRDDGNLYHGRLPSDDVDELNPWITARAPVAREVQS